MDIELDLDKSLEQNASAYFEKSKQAKRKLQGLKRAMSELQQKAEKVEIQISDLKGYHLWVSTIVPDFV